MYTFIFWSIIIILSHLEKDGEDEAQTEPSEKDGKQFTVIN